MKPSYFIALCIGALAWCCWDGLCRLGRWVARPCQ